MRCKPNLFVIGAMKAGTTFLYSVLNSHPDIYMSPIKEPNYFSSDLWDTSSHIAIGTKARIDDALSNGKEIHNALIKDLHLYQQLFLQFKGCSQNYGEASPSYLRSRVAAKNIHSYSAQAKIIVLLRDPIERAWSHYMMEKNEARVPDSVDELVEQELNMTKEGKICQHGILESGLYFKGISRYSEYFTFGNILVIDQSELFGDLMSLTEKLGTFLLLDGALFKRDRTPANSSVSPRYSTLNKYMALIGFKGLIRRLMPRPLIESSKKIYYQEGRGPSGAIKDRTYSRLIEYYSEDVKQLTVLLGNSSPVWTKKYL